MRRQDELTILTEQADLEDGVHTKPYSPQALRKKRRLFNFATILSSPILLFPSLYMLLGDLNRGGRDGWGRGILEYHRVFKSMIVAGIFTPRNVSMIIGTVAQGSAFRNIFYLEENVLLTQSNFDILIEKHGHDESVERAFKAAHKADILDPFIQAYMSSSSGMIEDCISLLIKLNKFSHEFYMENRQEICSIKKYKSFCEAERTLDSVMKSNTKAFGGQIKEGVSSRQGNEGPSLAVTKFHSNPEIEMVDFSDKKQQASVNIKREGR